MKYDDIKTLLTAAGGKKIVQSGGRDVIELMTDLSKDQNDQTFVGADRPEFTDYNGVESVDVEKDSINSFPTSNDANNISAQTKESNAGLTVFGRNDAQRFTKTASTPQFLQQIPSITIQANTTYCVTRWFEYDGDAITISFESNSAFNWDLSWKANFDIKTDGSIIQSTSIASSNTTLFIEPYPNGWYRLGAIFTTGANPDGNNSGILVRMIGDTGISLLTSDSQFEQSSYPTNYIRTQGTAVTRLAPSPVIENALPETGVIYGEVDMVRDGTDQRIFQSSGSASTQVSYFELRSANAFQIYIFGSNGGVLTQNNPFTWVLNTRKRIKYGVSYDAENVYLGLSDGINTYAYSQAHVINNTDIKNVTLGGTPAGTNNSSLYFKYLGKSTDIPTTEAEFTTLFNTMI